ncbi:MAG: hypothetical protein ACOH2L_05715 [Devosia sp.]
MSTAYLRARDHLQQAAAILQGTDGRSRQLLHIVLRTISLIDDMPPPAARPVSNVLDFVEFKDRFQRHS